MPSLRPFTFIQSTTHPPFQGFFINADCVRRLQNFLSTSPDGQTRPAALPIWMLALLRQDCESRIELDNCSISHDVQALLFPVDGEAAGTRPVVASLVLQLGEGCRWAGKRTTPETMPDSLVFTSYL